MLATYKDNAGTDTRNTTYIIAAFEKLLGWVRMGDMRLCLFNSYI